MNQLNFIKYLDFERTVNIQNPPDILTDLQCDTVSFVKEKDFGIDGIFFCDDFPAVFTKQVSEFDNNTLKEIAKIHQKIWNFKKVLFLYVYNEVKIRIYNCSEKPFPITNDTNYEKELDKIEFGSAETTDRQELENIKKIFSSIAIDTGIIWSLEEAHELRKKINLKHRVNEYLVESLLRLTHDLQDDGLDIELIHKNILRSLFLLYLEDRGATDEAFYNKIMEGAKSYFDILDNVDATYALFKKLKTNFNGNVFTFDENEIKFKGKDLKKIKKCFISGYDDTDQLKIFEEWRLFNFDIIPIELLSEIYENFLLKINPEKKKLSGTFFTPPSLVELMLNERLPINNHETDYEVKVLDPACGSGIFLVESFKRLVKRYEYKHNEKLTNYDKLQRLLLDNIYGIEYDPLSIKVAAFSLYLALLGNLKPKSLWQDRKLPYLINDPEDKTIKEQGKNLYRRDTIAENKEIESIEFNLVIGNPPFGTKELFPTVREYCDNEGFAKEKALPFLHKAIKFSPNGKVALIFNTKILTNTGSTYAAFRKWLFNDCYVEKVYNFSILRNAPKSFGGQLFGSATVPISIVFYRKDESENSSDRIVYYVPKTFIKNHVLEGIVIDSSDVKYLPREECQKPDTKIWKIAMWGNLQDIKLIKELSNKHLSLEHFFNKNCIDYGVGFEISQPANIPNSEIKKLPIHTPNNIAKYITPKPNQRIDTDKFRRLGKVEAFQNPHIILNEGVKVDEDKKLSILASFVDYKSAYTKGIVGIYSTKSDNDLLKVLTLFLNSEFVLFYSFLTTSSWGIERDVIKHNELFEVPYLLNDISKVEKEILLEKFEEIKNTKQKFNDVCFIEKEINTIILSKLSNRNNIVIKDALENIELFHKNLKSKLLLPILSINDYANMLCNELNDFLERQNLFANATIYSIKRFSPLMMIKISFSNSQKELFQSEEDVNTELKKIDKYLWENKSINIYIRKKMNYKNGNNIYLIRPNQRRFWTQTMAMEDASELILEILNED